MKVKNIKYILILLNFFSEEPDSEICLPCACSGSIKYVHVKCLKVDFTIKLRFLLRLG